MQPPPSLLGFEPEAAVMQVRLEQAPRLVVGVRDEVAPHGLLAGDLADSGHRRLREFAKGADYSNPRSAKEMAWLPATMKGSSTFTSTSARASLRFRVSSSSAWLGWAAPEGWLCAKMTAAALARSAAFTISLG